MTTAYTEIGAPVAGQLARVAITRKTARKTAWMKDIISRLMSFGRFECVRCFRRFNELSSRKSVCSPCNRRLMRSKSLRESPAVREAGIKAIIYLQAMDGKYETLEKAKDGWKKMSRYEKEATMRLYSLLVMQLTDAVVAIGA